MTDIIKLLETGRNDLLHGSGATKEQVEQAEKALGLTFAEDFRECLLEYGVFAINGHELTGITANPRVSVIKVTGTQKDHFPVIPDDWYVIEEANIDGIVIWQAKDCRVYVTQPGTVPIQIARDLSDFLLS